MKLLERFKKIFGKRSLREVGFVYFGMLANGASLFLISVIIGRYAEKDIFALFVLATALLSTVAEMSDFGLNGGLLRFAPHYIATGEEGKLKQLIRTIWNWRVRLSGILTVGGIILSYPIANYIYGQPALAPYLAFSFLGIGGVVLLGFVTTYLQARQRFAFNSLLQSGKGILRLLITGLLLVAGIGNLYAILAIYIFVPWVLFLIGYAALPKGFREVELESEVKEKIHSQLAQFSFWLAVWSFFAIIASRVDQAMLSHLLGLEKVAVYAVAMQFIYVYALATQSISAVLIPKMSALRSKDEFAAFAKKSLAWLIPAAIVGALLIYPSQYFITLFFGGKYADAMPVYLILAFGALLNILAIPFSLIINVYNKTSLYAISGVLQLFINIGLNFWLIPAYGVEGAAYAYVLGLAFSVAYTMLCAGYLLKYREVAIA